MAPRSTAGCYTCKRRKKKCDETQPQCLRCIHSRRECEGYAPLESPDSRGVMRRAKTGLAGAAPPRHQSSAPDSLEQQPRSRLPASTSTPGHSDSLTPPIYPDPSLSPWATTDDPVSFLPTKTTCYPSNTASTSTPPVRELSTGLPTPPFAPLGRPNVSGSTILSYPLNSGDNLPDRHTQDVMPFQIQRWPEPYQSTARNLPCGSISEVGEGDSSEDDPDEVKQELYSIPIPDPNTTENTLPFILQCYARWINLAAFEPEKAANPIRESVVNKFMRSPEERPRIVLLANVIGSLGKSIKPNSKVTTLVAHLSSEAYRNIDNFLSDKSSNDSETDRQKALDALDLVMEVILIQRYSHTMFDVVKFMEAVAPVFRRACPEPMNQYVNLPRAVMSPKINIRHFAASDVIVCATTGRPMLFRYDMTCPPDILECISDGRYGMQWLHGIPDQYIIILAHINVLAEELVLGATVSPHCVAEIETQIQQVEVWTDDSADPVSTIWRFTVRQCWRMTAYVYLYMVLCRARTDDPRVLESVNGFVRLMNIVKSARNPDAFLYIPMIIVGAAAYRKQDREVIRSRMLGLQECINPGSCGYDALHILLDLWARTDGENRAADWHDFRVSAFRIMGV
ncbi:unnamed protein product [Rhizoctonia solani]|uniref:Zn(2)-C6 fungal-type domain-containing protein n=1 Tax=Rhizoctonia solani TaxID=456999 RepID=A0A8H2XN41_9AGAM|nr:unnamed protein product [Rhizoctonia solani]